MELTLAQKGVNVEGPAAQIDSATSTVRNRMEALAGKIRVSCIVGSNDMEDMHLQVRVCA